ncbi:MAG: exodeoxyribonuclease V subunit gamma, partial [Phycisphaerae bacterium]|nr:exodeoxyribonuclease V subunit gamma [Phycisphaerae bacterium]
PGSGGLLTQLAATMDEWMQEALDPQELRTLADDNAAADPLAAARLADLSRLYDAYRAFLAEDRLDPAMELAVAESRAGDVPWLHSADVWVDGFAGLTALERQMLVRLATLARSTTVTLLIDPASPVLDRTDGPPNRFSLCARTERTFVMLREAAQAAGLTWKRPQRLRPAAPPRFATDDLRTLEREIFRGALRPTEPATAPPRDVRLIAAANRRVEVDAAVAEIQRLIRESNGTLRYRDIAVIVRDLEPYHDLLSAALTAQGIPFFIDRRRRTAHHPLVELLRLLPAIVHRRLAMDDVRLLLKTGLTPLAAREADTLENYVLAHGIHGLDAWLGPADWTYRRLFTHRESETEQTEAERVALDAINALRRRWIEPLREWITFASGAGTATGREWAEHLLHALDALGAGATLERWADDAAAAGLADEADIHRQVWRDAMAMLDDLVDALGDVALGAGDLSSVLDAALSEFTIGLSPPTLDQVLVGSIERSRHPDLAAVLLLGFNDGLFPLTPGEDVLLTDAERDRLTAIRGGAPVGTSRRQRILDEKMLAYIAFSRPSHTLWISYARADEAGSGSTGALRPSPFVRELVAALPGLRETRLDDPVTTRATWPVGRVRDLGARLALEFRLRPDTAEHDDPTLRGRWNALYERVRAADTYAHDVAPIMASLAYRNEPVLTAREADVIYGELRSFSASRIEIFATCPFRYFAQYTLGLEPRVEFEIAAIDFGLLHHKLLEEFFAELIRDNTSLADLNEQTIAERLEALANEWTVRLTDEALLDNERNKFLIDKSRGQLNEAMRRLRWMARLGSFRPRAVEWTFGFGHRSTRDTDAPEPLEIRTPKGRTIRLRGKIDRVDLLDVGAECLGVVLDYKRSATRKMPAWKLLHGLDLQLLTYCLALAQRGRTLAGRPIQPVGAFYVPLASIREPVTHPLDASEPERGIETKVKPRGLFNVQHTREFDRDLAAGAKSTAYNVAIKRDGGVAYADRSDAYDAGQMAQLIDFARLKIGELADRILDGDVAVRPYRAGTQMPCTFCDFREVCRFDHDTDRPRDIHGIGRTDALEQMREASQGDPA